MNQFGKFLVVGFIALSVLVFYMPRISEGSREALGNFRADLDDQYDKILNDVPDKGEPDTRISQLEDFINKTLPAARKKCEFDPPSSNDEEKDRCLKTVDEVQKRVEAIILELRGPVQKKH